MNSEFNQETDVYEEMIYENSQETNTEVYSQDINSEELSSENPQRMNSEFNQEINCKFYGKECRSEDHDDSEYCTLRMKRYFGLQDGYLCPMCETCSPTSWMEFYFMHGLHLTGYFDKSKTILAREIFNDEDYHPEIGYEKDLSPNYCSQIVGQKRRGKTICFSYIESPVSLQKSKAVVNIQNRDRYCFLYSILIVVNYVKIPR